MKKYGVQNVKFILQNFYLSLKRQLPMALKWKMALKWRKIAVFLNSVNSCFIDIIWIDADIKVEIIQNWHSSGWVIDVNEFEM